MEKRPRSGGKAGDRTDKFDGNRKDHDKGGKSDKLNNKGFDRGNQPKYDDTEEAKKQKNLIREIEKQIEEVQIKLSKIDKIKVVRRPQSHIRLSDKSVIENKIADFKEKIETKEKELKELQPTLKKLKEAFAEKKSVVTKLRSSVFFTNGAAKDFMERNEKKLQEEIKSLEKRLETESLSISDEKVVVKDIKRIKAMKVNFAPYQKRYYESQDAQDKAWQVEREEQIKKELIEDYK